MTDYTQQNKNLIIQYFNEGCKKEHKPLMLGLELEHFVVDADTKRSISYEGERGMESLLKRLSPLYDQEIESRGHLIALIREDATLSLEPASQLEVSIPPEESIEKIMERYACFRQQIEKILDDWNLELITTGYQIKDCVDELSLIPKKRYEFMDQYFCKIGKYGRQMMRGTASAQVSIDYYSEEDCKMKYFVAYRLKGILAKLTENTPFYEGEPCRDPLLRQQIWEKTDPARVLVEPYLIHGKMDFKCYTDFLFHAPIIVDWHDKKDYYSEKTIGELAQERLFTREEIEHIISMVFPMIRIKQYLEIRIADSMDPKSLKAYLIFLKGIFSDVKKTYETVADASFFSFTWEKQMECLMEIVTSGINNREREYMEGFFLSMRKDQTFIRKKEQGKEKIQKQIEQFYLDEVTRNFSMHQKGAIEALDYLEHSTAKYKGKTIYSLYVPKLLHAKTVDILRNAAQTMVGIMQKVIQRYLEDEQYRKLFPIDDHLKEWILVHPGYQNLLPVARVDIFLNEEDLSFQFCEFNTDGSSSMNEDRELCIAFEKTQLYRELKAGYIVGHFELFDSLVNAFLDNYDTYPGKKEHPMVAIVDFLELGCSIEEFMQFQSSFQKAGCSCVICDIRELTFDGENLYTKDRQAIDLIYRRAVTSDIVEHEKEVVDFIEAVKQRKVCCMGSFCTQVAHDKSLFYILRDEKTKVFLTPKENAFVEEHIPFTAPLTDDICREYRVLDEKEKWLIKPRNSYGARGIFAGINLSTEEWKKRVTDNQNQDYLLQAFVMPYQSKNIDFKKKEPKFASYSNLTGLYVYNGVFAGVYSRQAKHEIISSSYDENDIATITLIEK